MRLSIIQYKEILETMNQAHGIDLSGYALFSLKRNLGELISANHFANIERFKQTLKTDKRLLDAVLECVICDYTSLFREPSMWRMLRDKIIPELIQKGRLKIWMPDFSLEELYSLVILLDDMHLLDKTSIFISHLSKKRYYHWRHSELPKTDLLQAHSNLKRFDPSKPEDFIAVNNGIIQLPDNAKRIVNFVNGDVLETQPAIQPNLVLYRNQMIYHNHVRQHKVLKHIHKQLMPNGYFVIGAREQLKAFDINDQFKLMNTEEQIYKRKM